jgi:hypothetical protein
MADMVVITNIGSGSGGTTPESHARTFRSGVFPWRGIPEVETDDGANALARHTTGCDATVIERTCHTST